MAIFHRFVTGMVLLFVLLAATGGSAGMVRAQPGGQSQAQTITTEMTLDCVNMSQAARRYAVEQGYCGSESNGDVSTQSTDTSYGDCGSATISVWDDGESHGYAFFWGKLNSSRGTMTYVSWSIIWSNYTTGADGAFSGSDWQWSSTYETGIYRKNTGTGEVIGTLEAYVVLWWGGECVAAFPTTFDVID